MIPSFELFLADLPLAGAGREQRGLVDQVREVRAGEARRLARERVDVDDFRERLAARVHLEDLRATLAVGTIHGDLAVEASGAQQRRIEDVGPVGGRDHDDVVLRLEAIHLNEQLVERLLALVVSAAESRAAVAAHGVDLVHEDDAGRVLLGLLEQIAHARGAHADEHLHEVRPRDREERHARLAGDRACEQRLAGTGRPVEQNPRGNARAERLEALWILQELLDLVQLLHGLIHAGDIAEGDLGRIGGEALGARLAEGHHLRAPALHLVHEEYPEAQEQHERDDVGDDREQHAALVRFDVEAHPGLFDLRDQLRGGLLGVAEFVGFVGVLELDFDRVALLLDDDLFHAPARQILGDERLVGVFGSPLELPDGISLVAANATSTTMRIGNAALLKKRLMNGPLYRVNAATYGRLRWRSA